MKILEYIQSTGTQWLDTGIKPSTTTLIKAGVNVTEATGGVIVGHCNSDNSDYRLFNYQQTAYFDYGSSRISGSRININTYYDIEMGNYYLELNGTRVLSGSTVTGTGDYQNHNILTGYSPAESVRTKMKLYYLQIYNNGDLVFDGVPAKDENDVVCFYDKVSGSFFYNQGTGDYTEGPEVVTKTFLIESGGDYYTVSGGSLVNVGSTLNAQLFEDYGLNTEPDWSDYSSLANPSVLCWDEYSARSMTAITTGIPGATVAVSQKVPTGSGIQTVTINSDNDTLYSVSFDDGTNWWKYANGAWAQVSAITDGMTKAEVEAISASAWEEKNTGFAKFRFTLLDGNGYMTSIRVDYAGGGSGDSVSWTQLQSTGTKIAEIEINGTTQDVYAPDGGSTYTEGDGIDISAQNAISVDTTFTEASTRANIASGESFATILGKIKKFFSDLKAVAFSGSYNDLSDKPTIPAAQVNSDWNVSSGVAQILNKPTIPSLDDVKSVKNYYDSRPTSADVQFGDGRLRHFKASSSMTTGKPANDGHIIHLAWDGNNGYDGQIALINADGGMQFRTQSGGTWSAWRTIINSGNIGSQSVNYANSAGSATNASNATRLYAHTDGGTGYVSSDTHILKLGFFERDIGYNNVTLLVTSEFWGNQHGSADIINMNQDSNGSNTQDLWRIKISDKATRTFYYKVANDVVYLYVYVTGGNGYGKWNVSVMQASDNKVQWIDEVAYNQSSSGLTEIPYSGRVGYANSAGSAGNVTGTVAVANGGTGATTKPKAVASLFGADNISTSANYFLTITSSFARVGYTSVTEARTVLGLKSAAYLDAVRDAITANTVAQRDANGHIIMNDCICTSVRVRSSSEWLPLRGGGAVTIRNYANTAYATAYASAFTVSSSRRYKENIVGMTEEDAKALLSLRPVTFDYKEGVIDGDRTGQKGLIAEEVAEIETFPVVYNQDGEVEGLDYSKFVPQLIKLCQMQQKQIDDLTARLEVLESRMK